MATSATKESRPQTGVRSTGAATSPRGPVDLTAFLLDAKLSDYEPQLVALGVSEPADIPSVEGAFRKATQRQTERGARETDRQKPRGERT